MAYSSRKRHSALMSSERSKYLKFGGATVVILISLGFLAYTGVQESKSYYVTIKELRGLGDGSVGRDGVFHAKQLQAKCASKYAPQQPGAPGNGAPAKSMTQVQGSGAISGSN